MTAIIVKSLRDRAPAMTVSTVIMAAWLVLAMAIYRDIDTSIYTDLPEGLRQLVGIPAGADSATLAYTVMLEFVAAVTFAGLAVSMGSAAVAGEERDGTIGLLLANPVSRSRLTGAKATAMCVLVTVAAAGLWAGAEVTPRLLDVDLGDSHLAAMALHLALNSIFHGMVALAIGAWTGDRTAASAGGAAVVFVSYFAVGLLPLVDAVAGLARLFPWYYFTGGDPLVNGAQWDHLGVLAAGSVGLAVMAVIGVDRRDLRGHSIGASMLDRLRAGPRSAELFDHLAGSTRVSHIWIKITSEHQAVLIVTAVIMFAVMGLAMGPMYTAIEGDIAELSDDLPEVLMAFTGNGDLATPEGFFTVETYSLMAPAAVMVVTIVIGAQGLAGEESRRTAGLLFANPIPRRRLVFATATALITSAAALGTAIFAGVACANALSGLDMSYRAIGATTVLVTLLGIVFGLLALAIGAASGSTRAAVQGAVGAAVGGHVLDSLLTLDDDLAGWARLTPNHYFLGSDPLVNGMNWSHAAVLAITAAVLTTAAAWAFDRRDLRLN